MPDERVLTVRFMSRRTFQAFQPDNSAAFVSINSPGNMPAVVPRSNMWVGGLLWERDDDDSPVPQSHIRMIGAFVEAWRAHDFVVHCDAGVSRSAAVAQYIGALFDREVIGHDSDGLNANAVIKASLMHHLWSTQFKEDHIERLCFKKT